MKKLLLSALLLFITINTIAQEAPYNYDGGEALRAAILKAKSKNPNSKNKKTTVKNKYTVRKVNTPENAEEKLFYATHGYSSPEEVKRITSSPAYNEQVAEAKRAEEEHLRILKEQAPQRKADSLAKVQKENEINLKLQKQKMVVEKSQHDIDSIQKAKDAAYMEEQRKEMKKNNSWNPFRRN